MIEFATEPESRKQEFSNYPLAAVLRELKTWCCKKIELDAVVWLSICVRSTLTSVTSTPERFVPARQLYDVITRCL